MADDPTLEQLTETADHAAMRESFALHDNLRRLGALVGTASLNRNLKSEDNAVSRNIDICERILFKDHKDAFNDANKAAQQAGEDMDILAGKDVVININNGGPTPSATGTPASSTKADTGAGNAGSTPVSASVPVSQPTPAASPLAEAASKAAQVNDSIPTWMKVALVSSIVGSPIVSAGTAYFLQPDPQPVQVTAPAAPNYGFQVLPGVPDGSASATADPPQ